MFLCVIYCCLYSYIQELPEQWANTKKLAAVMKLQAAPLQANEVSNVRRMAASYDVEQYTYREAFRKMKAFQYACDDPYELIDEVTFQVLMY